MLAARLASTHSRRIRPMCQIWLCSNACATASNRRVPCASLPLDRRTKACGQILNSGGTRLCSFPGEPSGERERVLGRILSLRKRTGPLSRLLNRREWLSFCTGSVAFSRPPVSTTHTSLRGYTFEGIDRVSNASRFPAPVALRGRNGSDYPLAVSQNVLIS